MIGDILYPTSGEDGIARRVAARGRCRLIPAARASALLASDRCRHRRPTTALAATLRGAAGAGSGWRRTPVGALRTPRAIVACAGAEGTTTAPATASTTGVEHRSSPHWPCAHLRCRHRPRTGRRLLPVPGRERGPPAPGKAPFSVHRPSSTWISRGRQRARGRSAALSPAFGGRRH